MDSILLFLAKYVFGYILQDCFIIIGIFGFGKQKLNKEKFILLNAILIPSSILVRTLPINLGIHTLLNVAIILYLIYHFCDFDLHKLIRSTLLTTLFLLFFEVIFFVSLKLIFGDVRTNAILNDPLQKAISYIPCNLLFGIVLILHYRRMLRRNYSEVM